MGKKLTATLEEVEEAKAQVEAQIEELRKALEGKIKDTKSQVEKKLAGEVQSVKDGLGRVSDDIDQKIAAVEEKQVEAQELARAAVDEVRTEIAHLRPVVDEQIQGVREELEQRIVEVDTGTRGVFAEELESLCTKFDQELGEVKANTDVLVKRCGDEAASERHRQRQEVDANLEKAQQEAREGDDESRRVAAEALQEAVDKQASADKDREKRMKKMQDEAWERHNQLEQEMKKQFAEAKKELLSHSDKHSSTHQQTHEENTSRFEGLDEQIEKLWASASDLENMTTRKVEWVIRNANKALRLPKADDPDAKPQMRSWRSAPFDVAGARGCALEIQIFPPVDPSEPVPEGEERPKGDCALVFHARKGMSLAFRLQIGKAFQVAEHKFIDDAPFVGRKLCFWGEHMNQITDTLTVSVEILESLFDIKTDPPLVECEDPEQKPLEGKFVLQRHVNNRVFDQVKGQVDHFKSRMVRRVEWRLEQASEMRNSFPRGAPIVSKEFDAAGIEGMQFIFYPNGYDGATDGFASAFLSAPAGASLKCHLQVGKERRELNHLFEKAGYFGRANFCRFESARDEEDDTVLILLDIQEAQQDVVAQGSNPPPAAAGIRNLSRKEAPVMPIGSSLKLQRTMDRLPPVLQEVKTLPSLWSKKNIYEPLTRIDGLKLMKAAKGSSGGRSSPLLR